MIKDISYTDLYKKESTVMAEKRIKMTKERYDSQIEKLTYLKNEKRDEIARKIEIARGYGDLSENAEYDAARDEQAKMEAEIADLEKEINLAEIIDASEILKFRIYRHALDKEFVYSIVSSSEADPLNGLISDESDVGKALINRGSETTIHVTLPNGKQDQIDILEILSDN